MQEEETMSLRKVAAIEDVKVRTVRYWIAQGRLRARKSVGGHWRVRLSDLEAAREVGE